MLYEVRDPVLGAGGVLHVEVLALATTDGLVVRIEYVAGVADPADRPQRGRLQLTRSTASTRPTADPGRTGLDEAGYN